MQEESEKSLEERRETDENYCQKLFSDLSAGTSVRTSFQDAIQISRFNQDRPQLLRVNFQSIESKLQVTRTS